MFTLGTRLTRVTLPLRTADPERALVRAGEQVPDWSGGTRLGETLKAFLDRWGARGMARGAVVVVFSDGWERGDAVELGEQMQRLKRLAHRVVWVEPAPRQGRLRAGPARHRCRPAALRRLRRRSLAGGLRRGPGGGRPCVRCSTSCCVVGGRRDRRRRHRRGDLPVRPPARRAPRCSSAPTAPPSARSRAAASRAPSTSSASRVVESGAPGARALRRLRRRRVRGRPHLRRHPRRVRREGEPADLPRARRHRRRHRGRSPGRAGHGDRAPRPGVAGSPGRRTPRGGVRLPRQRPRRPTRSPTTRSACSRPATARP